MRSILTWSKSHRKHLWLNRGIHLMFLLAVLGAMPGCSGGGGGGGENDGCGGSSVNALMNAQVAEIIAGLMFTFPDGEAFHEELVGEKVTMTLDPLTGTTVPLTLATESSMADGEARLACDPASDSSCSSTPPVLPEVTVTASDFPSGAGPQVDDVLNLGVWSFSARLDNCTNRITATMSVQDSEGKAVPSEPLDLSETELCPLIGDCPSS